MRLFFYSILLPLLLGSCKGSQLATSTPKEAPLEIRNLDTLVVTASPMDESDQAIIDTLAVYRNTFSRTIDLLHTDLDLRFDWSTETVIGSAILKFTPYNLPISEVVLDAKNFTWHSVKNANTNDVLTYEADNASISIQLADVLTRADTLELALEYVASPSGGASASAAITSDQGLFFINADGRDSSKPQQIWTQGETEFNSNWFPTVDKPNERQTHRIALTVQNRFKTLSNGVMVSSEIQEDGMRTDVWVMDQPHAPYLVMLGIGEYAVIKEEYPIPVEYYVEPKYAEDADAIFNHTPEMIDFFSNLTGVPYPWKKYSQIVVRDYVSGAMENTTAVIYGDQVQRHRRELVDDHNDYIVAHELIHHWFGNLVTCESWSNLTLNEGFANYGEYLWFEHKYGLDYAEHHRFEQLDEYLFEAETKRHPLIDFRYADKEDMFDAHSYNKGGLVLHMLRKYLGDELFFESWKAYLQANAYQAVEVHHLRLAVEKVTGQDMNWFFNQWFLSSGHPELTYDHRWNPESSSLTLQIDQIQDVDENLAIYKMPIDLMVTFESGAQKTISLLLNERSQEFILPLAEAPQSVVLDPAHITISEIQNALSVQEAQLLYNAHAPYTLRNDIVERLAGLQDDGSLSVLKSAMEDPFWEIRRKALNYIDWEEPGTPQVRSMAESDPHSQVRADALMIIALIAPNSSKDLVISNINQHDPYPVVAAAISALFQIDPERCLQEISGLQDEEQPDIVAALSGIYRQMGDPTHIQYFAEHMGTISGFPALSFYGNLQALMVRLDLPDLNTWLQKCAHVAKSGTLDPYARIGATRTLIGFMKQADQIDGLNKSDIDDLLDQILASETNDQILSIYHTMIGS